MIISPKNAAASFSFYHKLRRLCFKLVWLIFCSLIPPEFQRIRHLVLSAFGCCVGKGARIYGTVRIWDPALLEIGMYSTLGPEVLIYNPGRIIIGKGVIVSQRATVCSASHDYTEDDFQLLRNEIRIDDKAWICSEAFVGPNSQIGTGVVVAARAVTTGKILPWTVVGGNPAKCIKERPFVNYINDELNNEP